MPKDAIEHPLFTPFRTETDAMHSTNRFTVSDADYRVVLHAKFLADAIPATSFAAGRNQTGEVAENFNMQVGVQDNAWPSARINNNERKWLHSDIRDIAYYYLYQVFRKMKDGD